EAETGSPGRRPGHEVHFQPLGPLFDDQLLNMSLLIGWRRIFVYGSVLTKTPLLVPCITLPETIARSVPRTIRAPCAATLPKHQGWPAPLGAKPRERAPHCICSNPATKGTVLALTTVFPSTTTSWAAATSRPRPGVFTTRFPTMRNQPLGEPCAMKPVLDRALILMPAPTQPVNSPVSVPLAS